MRRFDRELRTMSPRNLKWLIDEATLVFQKSHARRRPKRPNIGVTHYVAQLHTWHLDDATSVLRPPGASDVVFASSKNKLRIVIEHDGSIFWSTVPVKAEFDTPLAYSLSYEHARHAAECWWKSHGQREIGGLRLSTGGALLEFFDGQGAAALTEYDGKVRVTPRVEETMDWDAVWAQPPEGGARFDPAQLTRVIRVLLDATSHANGGSGERHQDYAALWFEQGFGRVWGRSSYCEASAPGLDELHFGIGRKDAKALIRALALMVVGRRRKVAEAAGVPVGPPRWSKVGELNVITNGDVGFAFPDPAGHRPPVKVPEEIVSAGVTRLSYSEFAKGFPFHEILVKDRTEVVRLVRNGEGQAFFTQSQRGLGLTRLPLTLSDSPLCGEIRQVGPIGQTKFNLIDLTRLTAALSSSDINVEILGRADGEVWGLRIAQEMDDALAFRSLIVKSAK
jgi:hypothetical protein